MGTEGDKTKAGVSEITSAQYKDVATWLYALEDVTDKMTQWEIDFYTNMVDRTSRDVGVTVNQFTHLEKLYRKYI